MGRSKGSSPHRAALDMRRRWQRNRIQGELTTMLQVHLLLLCARGESLTSANLSVLICKTGNDSFAIRINWEGIHTAIYNVLHNCGFLRRILVILDALHSHIHFRTTLSTSVKNCVGLALCSSGEKWNLYHIVFSAQDRGIFFLDLSENFCFCFFLGLCVWWKKIHTKQNWPSSPFLSI